MTLNMLCYLKIENIVIELLVCILLIFHFEYFDRSASIIQLFYLKCKKKNAFY